MSIDRRINAESDISPELREHISAAAQKIRADHNAELENATKADVAVRLFRSLIHPNASEEPSVVSGEGLSSLAAGLGALLGDAVRTGTELVAIPVTALAQEWMATMLGPGAKPNLGPLPAEARVPAETSQPQPLATPQMSGVAVDAAVPGANVPEVPTVSPEEARLRDVFRRFMPMLVFSLNQGGTGYGLAEKVITLFGRPTYDQASSIGKDRIMAILEAEQDLWAQVSPIKDKFSRFLDEFLGYEAYVAKNPKC